MSTKLFVGSLSWNTTSSELQDAFAACGDVVEAKVITDRDTGRSRGFGFVTFQDADSATRAIEQLDVSDQSGHWERALAFFCPERRPLYPRSCPRSPVPALRGPRGRSEQCRRRGRIDKLVTAERG